MTTSDSESKRMAYDIWPQLSVLSSITTRELSEILRSEFTTRQAKALRRELVRLRRAYVKNAADFMGVPVDTVLSWVKADET